MEEIRCDCHCPAYRCDYLFARETLFDLLRYPSVFLLIVFDIVIRLPQPPSQFHQSSRTQTVEAFDTLLEPTLLNQGLHHLLCLAHRKALSCTSLGVSSILCLSNIFRGTLVQLDRLHRRDSHDFMSWRIVGLEHCVEDSFEEADFVGCMYGRQLSDRIAG